MKRIGILTLVLAYLLCLTLGGCRASGAGQSSETTGGTTAAAAPDTTAAVIPDTTGTTVPQDVPDTTPSGRALSIDGAGKLRITYSGDYNSVRYVTSASALPDYEELKQYDDAWFETHALVLVIETVGSGSVDVGIESIYVDNGTATVTLSHELDGAGTADMAAWLLWAEVETGLDCQWAIANPALESDASQY